MYAIVFFLHKAVENIYSYDPVLYVSVYKNTLVNKM